MAKRPSRPKRKPQPQSQMTPQLRRNALLIVLGLLFVVMLIEWRALNGYSKSFTAVRDWYASQTHSNPSDVSAVDNLLHGSPTKTEGRLAGTPVVYYRWSSLMRNYTFHIPITEARQVAGQPTPVRDELQARPATPRDTTAGADQKLAQSKPATPLPPGPTTVSPLASTTIVPPAKPSPQGALPNEIRAVFPAARYEARNKRADSPGFINMLRQVAPHVRSVSVSTDASRPVWHQMSIARNGLEFDVLRFKSPLDVPADMHWIYTVPGEDTPNWYILPMQGSMDGFDSSHEEWNAEFDDIKIPESQTAVFQSLLNGRILPNQEYLLWFIPPTAAGFDTNVAITLIPTTKRSESPDAQSVAGSMGVKWHHRPIPGYTPPPKEVHEALQVARRSYNADDLQQAHQALSKVLTQLPELRISNTTQGDKVNHLIINGTGLGFDAFRFRSQLREPADLHLLTTGLMAQWQLRWNVLPVEGRFPRSTYSETKHSVSFPGVDAPSNSYCQYQSWSNSPILPNRDYILYVASQDAAPRQMHMAVGLTLAGACPPDPDPFEVAEAAGVTVEPLITRPQSPGAIVRHIHGGVTSVAYALDGKVIISRSAEGKIAQWDSSTGTAIGPLTFEDVQRFNLVSVSADGRQVAAITHKAAAPRVVIWDLHNNTTRSQLMNDTAHVSCIAFSRNGSMLACGAKFAAANNPTSRGIVFWDTQAMREVNRVPTPSFDPKSLAFSPAKDELVVSACTDPGPNQTAHLLWIDQPTKAVTAEQRCKTFVMHARISPDGSRLAAVEYQDSLVMRDAISHNIIDKVNHNTLVILAVAYSPDGQRLATTEANGTIRVLDTKSLRTILAFHGHQSRERDEAETRSVRAIAYSPTGRQIVTGSLDDNTMRIWPIPDPVTGDAAHIVKNSIGMKLVSIPAGAFVRGTREDQESGLDEREEFAKILYPSGRPAGPIQRTPQRMTDQQPAKTVKLTKPFFMSVHEVTVGQFKQFVTATNHKTEAEQTGKGSHIRDSQKGLEQRPELNWRTPGFAQTDQHPVVQVSFQDVTKFCEWLTSTEKLTYRLPTEAEWEYTCRGGFSTDYGIWNLEATSEAAINANVADSSIRAYYKTYGMTSHANDGFVFTAPVGSYHPNPFGLYDMHGNVYEWCSDWYDPRYYSTDSTIDPKGPPSGTARVQRGGSFFHYPKMAAAPHRDHGKIDEISSCVGFRVVRELP